MYVHKLYKKKKHERVSYSTNRRRRYRMLYNTPLRTTTFITRYTISLTSLERRFGVVRVRLRVSQEDPIEDDAFSLLRDSSSPLFFLSSPLLVSKFLVGSHRASEEVYRARASVEERQRTSGSAACVRGDDDVVDGRRRFLCDGGAGEAEGHGADHGGGGHGGPELKIAAHSVLPAEVASPWAIAAFPVPIDVPFVGERSLSLG